MSMKKFNKATLAMAVAGALAASSAHAVNIAEDGLGDFIISPFYTVRDGFQTYINVTNTSEETVVFKIRFREHYNSRDARDFNVILSPYDVWTAAVIMNDAGTGARLVTHDHTCTAPISIRDEGIDFTNIAYYGLDYGLDNDDGGPTDLERTTQGYFEVINMGQDAEITGTDNSTLIALGAMHVDVGDERWPVDCSYVEQQFANNAIGEFVDFDEPENSLKVNVAIINVNDGLGFAVPVTTLANFFNPGAAFQDQTSATELVVPPSDDNPNATDAFPQLSNVHTNVSGTGYGLSWLNNDETDADPVSSVLMRTSIINQYRVEDAQADTDWVITLPTKNFYVDDEPGGVAFLAPYDPFPNDFDGVYSGSATRDSAGACFQVQYNFWDREEDTLTDPSVVQPSPPVPGAQPDQLCREVNVIQLGEGVLSGYVPTAINAPFDSGWMRIDLGPSDVDLADAYDLTDDFGATLEGLPVIGFAIQNLDNWSVGNELVQYGFAWEHSYGRSLIDSSAVQWGNNPAQGDDLAGGVSGSL